MKILIAYDGSPGGDAMLNSLQWVGLPPATEAMVMSVEELWLPPPLPGNIIGWPELEKDFTAHIENARLLAARAAHYLQSKFPQWSITSQGYLGSPASQILEKATSWSPDLIAVGSHGRSALGRVVFGSVSQKVTTEAQCSVLVGRNDRHRDSKASHIIIGVDGSLSANTAAKVVAARSWPEGSEARLVTCVGPVSLADANLGIMLRTVGVEKAEESITEELAYAQGVQQALHTELRTAGLLVSSVIRKGAPKHILIEEAEKWQADCIFLGSTNFTRWERFLLGSVSTAVVARAHCSVEVVRTTRG